MSKIRVCVKMPNDIPNLYGWWDASDFNSLSNGTSITTWPDKSGNGLDFVYNPNSLIGSPIPSMVPSAKQVDGNGRSVLAGIGKYDLSLNIFALMPITIFCVFKFNDLSLNTIALGANPGGNVFEINTLSTKLNIYQSSAKTSSVNNIDTVTYNQIAYILTNTASQKQTRINGYDIPTVTNSLSSLDMLFLNYRNFSSNRGDSNWCEIIIYNRALSNSEFRSVDRYLKFKWGL